MKKIKLLFLMAIIVILCTGCSVEYNINITRNNIEEVINVTDYISVNRTREDILTHYNMWYPTFVNYITKGETIELEDYSEKVEGIEYHQKQINEINNGYNYTYNYNYSLDEYYDSYVLASAFLETTVHEGSDNLVIRTSKESLLCEYNYFDSAKINITIDPEVYELNYTNTTNIKNNTYTWTINRDNCNDSQILLTLNTKKMNSQSSSSNNNNEDNNVIKKIDSYLIYIFLGILILIIYLGYRWFNKMKDKNNTI